MPKTLAALTPTTVAKILQYLRKEPASHAAQIAPHVGLTTGQTSKALKQLESAGKVELDGQSDGWVLTF